jgi:NAD(P)-dependent dehydrogenase (short-subunit alcohol dehydrogenase family)
MSYSISRLAMEQAIGVLAQATAPHVRVNGIALGATVEGHTDTPDTFEKIRARADLKRVSSVEEVCATVKFLLAADSVTGQVISLSADAAKNA